MTVYITLLLVFFILFSDQFTRLEWILFGILLSFMIIFFGLLYYRLATVLNNPTEETELPRTINVRDLMYLRLALTDRDFNANDYNDLLALDRSNNSSNGLTNEELQLIPSYTLNSTATAADADENLCTICLDPMISGEIIRTTPCQHSYHLKCIDKWLLQKAICPMCNHVISFDNAV